tara:strand:+ start:2282 stop:2476 length:195 start_codon:yes stop_codon:yes gene_type:complete
VQLCENAFVEDRPTLKKRRELLRQTFLFWRNEVEDILFDAGRSGASKRVARGCHWCKFCARCEW